MRRENLEKWEINNRLSPFNSERVCRWCCCFASCKRLRHSHVDHVSCSLNLERQVRNQREIKTKCLVSGRECKKRDSMETNNYREMTSNGYCTSRLHSCWTFTYFERLDVLFHSWISRRVEFDAIPNERVGVSANVFRDSWFVTLYSLYGVAVERRWVGFFFGIWKLEFINGVSHLSYVSLSLIEEEEGEEQRLHYKFKSITTHLERTTPLNCMERQNRMSFIRPNGMSNVITLHFTSLILGKRLFVCCVLFTQIILHFAARDFLFFLCFCGT